MPIRKLLLATVFFLGCTTIPQSSRAGDDGHGYQHALLISVDGMHAVDLQRYVADPAHDGGALASLAGHGLVYPKALTTAPSDSFPGMIAPATGGSPKSAGVFYDDSYDRTMFAPGSNCVGDPGAETKYAETIDRAS